MPFPCWLRRPQDRALRIAYKRLTDQPVFCPARPGSTGRPRVGPGRSRPGPSLIEAQLFGLTRSGPVPAL